MSSRPHSSPKIRRWIDLLAALLSSRYPAPFERLIQQVPGYLNATSPDARRRMFERDKDELRAYGVPIETRTNHDGEVEGYTLDRREFYLPYLTLQYEGRTIKPTKPSQYGYQNLPGLPFDADELAAVVEAGKRAGSLGDPVLAEAAASAIRKLAFDMPVDAVQADPGPHLVSPRAIPDRATFEILGDALDHRKRVSFQYHSMGSDAVTERSVEPYGLFFAGQHWYLAARDVPADALKNFRLSRMSEVRAPSSHSPRPDYDIPPDFRLREHAHSRQAWELGDAGATEVVVRLVGKGGAAQAAAEQGEGIEGRPDQRRFRVRRLDAFARWLLSFAGELQPVEPAELVADFERLAAQTLALYR